MNRRPAPSGRAIASVASALALGLLFSIVQSGTPAQAYWSTATSAASAAAGSAASVNQAATPNVTASKASITVSWAASTLSSGAAITGYTVQRYDTGNVAQTVGAGCAGTRTTLACTETAVPNGLWTYRITPVLATNWVGPQSASSAQVRSDSSAPTNSILRNVVSGSSYKSSATSNTIYYRGVVAGSLTLTNTVADSSSGPASSKTAALTNTPTGWSHTPSTVNSPTGGPYVSNPFSWVAGSTSAPKVVVTGGDTSGNTANTTISFVNDSTAPTSGTFSYPDGQVRTSTVAVKLTSLGADTGGSGVASAQLQGATAPLTGNTCGAFGAFTLLKASPTTNESQAVPAGFCYRYQYVVTDNVGNVLTVTSPSTVKSGYAPTILATAGLTSYWQLGEASGTTIVDSDTPPNNGAYVNAPTLGTAGAIAGDPNTAVTFDGSADYGTASRALSGTFSIELWFSSTQGRGTTNQWYDGAGLVDASATGTANDFGISLMADGRVGAGIGNPDTSLFSGPGENDGAWHHVVLTRTQATGDFRLYVDGALAQSATGNTNALSASANLNFGRIQTGTNYLAGSLDEIALYSVALTPAQVTAHYQAGLP